MIAAACPKCGDVRLMREPRRWEPEIVALGGPEWTSECLTCGNTIDVTSVMNEPKEKSQ